MMTDLQLNAGPYQSSAEDRQRQRDIAHRATGGLGLLDHAKNEYARVLRFPFNSYERHYNQAYMCFLRDFIAEHEGRDAEAVQTEYERIAFDDISRAMFGGTAAEMKNSMR